MLIYIAGRHPIKNGKHSHWGGLSILESFYYLRNNPEFHRLIQEFDSFLLDSGAFTFMSGNGSADWDRYTQEYADFINKYDISLFFELDIDSIVGLSEVERLRNRLEKLTGKKPIPVWHKSRGLDYFHYMCKEYPYVAIGGIVTKEIERKTYEKAFPWFIEIAHKAGSKIHGLGYTSFEGLKKYKFDSVDSTAWLYGNRGGYLYIFDPRTGEMKKKDTPQGMRLRPHESARHNFLEWVKFVKWAKKNL